MSMWNRKTKVGAFVLYALLVGCAFVQEFKGSTGARSGALDVNQHRWWSGLGPVLPHETFSADCSLCHAGSDWHELTETFEFDHEQETGRALLGAHREASCLRCHNDRGVASVFDAKGCIGCHEDTHQRSVGTSCEDCHSESGWATVAATARSKVATIHRRAGFALIGAHAMASCSRCHPGIDRGAVQATSKSCEACHGSDLASAKSPDHIALGWTQRCDRCHVPLTWQQAEL